MAYLPQPLSYNFKLEPQRISALVCRPIFCPRLQIHIAFQPLFNFLLELGHRLHNLLTQDIPKTGKSFTLAFQVLVASLGELNKLPRVNVWVASIFDVINDFVGDLSR